jgi:hypothetical protein
LGGLLEDASLLMVDVAVDERETEEREKHCGFFDARARGFKVTVHVLAVSPADSPELSSEDTAQSLMVVRRGGAVSGEGREEDEAIAMMYLCRRLRAPYLE